MRITHTFLDKCATIIKGSNANTSLSPLIELCYGNLVTRALLHFDTSRIEALIEDKTYPDISKLRHVLKLYNTCDINPYGVNWKYPDPPCYGDRQRATSFDIVFYKIEQDWDSGRGFDFAPNIFMGDRAFQTDGVNWFYRRTNEEWYEEGGDMDVCTPIATMRFEYGNEQPKIDITGFVNDIITGATPNYGIGMAFRKDLELTSRCDTQYVAFFTNHTNQIFAPYVETTYMETIEDDRSRFYNGKDNKLYFYSALGGQSFNLERMPICELMGRELEVHQATKGVYYAEVPCDMKFEDDTMYYDKWTYWYDCEPHRTELYFTTMPYNRYFSFGLPFETENHPKFTPFLYGIKHNEVIVNGDIRKVNVECKIDYTSNQMFAVDNIEYRLYYISGDREFDVYPWSKVERAYNTNYFIIDTKDLLPSEYHIDIRATYDVEKVITKNCLTFAVGKDITEQKA